MTPLFAKNLKRLESKEVYSLLRGIKRGFEKECLRVDTLGSIAQTRHPKGLGSSLTHPFITTDFSEAQLEFITPPTSDLHEPFRHLAEIHAFVYAVLAKEELHEILWAGSMPCYLPQDDEIPIAQYGHSNLGQLKTIYRNGLGLRYGRHMQTISGIHYNFSLPEAFFKKHFQGDLSEPSSPHALRAFISERYLDMIRNSVRWGWLIPLLFGATPAICKDFFNKDASVSQFLEPLNIAPKTFIGQYATSLRLSDLGYSNKAQDNHIISYNSFPEFLETMHYAVHTPYPPYTTIGIKKDGEYQQLNDSILQIEDEHYAMFRPKRVPRPAERTLAALMREGIEYVEVRALDINPFLPLGVEPKTQYVLDTFLMTCLFLESPPMNAEEMARIQYNHHQIIGQGRNPLLTLKDPTGNLQNALKLTQEFLSLMLNVAYYLDRAYGIDNFSMACRQVKRSLDDLNTLPSAHMLNAMVSKQVSYVDFMKQLSLQHQQYFDQYLSHLPFPQKLVQYYERLSQESLSQQLRLEEEETTPFPEFLENFLAT